MNHYEALQVPRAATEREIRDAYRMQVQVWHPDKHAGTRLADKANERMKAIAAAWEVLNRFKSDRVDLPELG